MGKEQTEAYLKDRENKMSTQKVAQMWWKRLYVMGDMNTMGQAVHTNSRVFLV